METSFASNENGVCLSRIVMNPGNVTTQPRRGISITPDSVTLNGKQFASTWRFVRPVKAVYSIYNSDGDCDVAEEDVPIEGFLRIDELSLHETGVYQLQIVAKEDCILTLITDYQDGEPEIESVSLSSAGVYHLDIVVTDDNE